MKGREKVRQQILQALSDVDIGCLDLKVPETQLGHEDELQAVLLVSQGLPAYLEG